MTTVQHSMNNEQPFLLYTAPSGQIAIHVHIQDETLWLTQKNLAELFAVTTATINHHLKNIFETGELDPKATIRKFLIVRQEGNRQVSRDIEHYNLDAIISVGYRVNSIQATHFRQWATQTLKQYIIKGFVLDDKRLKQGETTFGKDYFHELLERVRSIRASERRIWQKITDIFKECSIDYDPNATLTKQFYAHVQDKFHHAITGQTASEIIYSKADKNALNMGLTTWKNAPSGRILKSDTTIAKNYLNEKQIRQLERTITAYFDYIENLIERADPQEFTMQKLSDSVNKFLAFNEYNVLEGYGSIKRSQADKKAHLEYEEFNKTQNIHSDFDKQIQKMLNKKE